MCVGQGNLIILKRLLNTRMIWMTFMKTLKKSTRRKVLVIFYDLIDDILSNKNAYPIIADLFIANLFSRNLSVYLVFTTQSYLTVTKIY